MSVPDARDLLYEHYEAWKSWNHDDNKDRTDIFRREIQRANITAPARILEIGFGKGQFLDWAVKNGFHVCGIEQLEALCVDAKNRGHRVFCGNANAVMEQITESFDLVVLFDVCEHLTIPELFDLFSAVKSCLAPNGIVLARFPNAGSPFGGIAQHGDATHVTTLTGSKIDQIGRVSGLRLKAQFESYTSEITEQGKGFSGHWIPKKVAHCLQRILNVSLGLLYFGQIVPMSPVMTVLLESDS